MLTQLRHTIRALRKAPTFTIPATITLALGIGATAAVVSIVDSVLLRTLPYRDAPALAFLMEQSSPSNQRLPSYLAFRDFQRAITERHDAAVEGIAFVRGDQVAVRQEDGLHRAIAAFVTPGFFAIVGGNALKGRTFAAEEQTASANRVAVISFDFWRRRFGSDSAIVGRSITLDSVPTTIVGVMPRGFALPSFAEVWLPIAGIENSIPALQKRGVHVDSRTIIRMRSASDSSLAAAQLGVVAAGLAKAYPEDAAHFTRVALPPIATELLGNVKPTLLGLTSAAILVLLLGCLNVATLSLIRSSGRAREVAVRMALGATRSRLVRELLLESSVIAAIGAVGGIVLAAAIIQAVRTFAAGGLPRADELTMDSRALTIAVAVSLFALILSGLVPAWRSSGVALDIALRGGHRGATGNRPETRLRGALVALQFALALMLLIGAGLLAQSFRRLQSTPEGFDVRSLATTQIFPPAPRYARPADALALYNRLRDAVKAVSGVQDVAIVNHAPGGGSVFSKIEIAGRASDAETQGGVLYRTASAEYLRTMGMQMSAGRWFSPSDMSAPDGAGFVLNETAAKKFWSGQSAIGQTITLHRSSQGRPDVGAPLMGSVIGVVRDVHQFGRDVPTVPEAFVPYTLEVWPWITLVARGTDPARLSAGIRKAILSVDPNIPVTAENAQDGVQTARQSSTLDQRELALAMIAAFAVAALVLAAVGLYGVVAYTVTQRTREVGIRMALGATATDIGRLVLIGALKLVATGIVVGLALAIAGTRLVQSLLFETAPTDLATFLVTPVVLGTVALLATWPPALRAVRVQPACAMRQD
ncbi:MAG: ABC transporter permease [Gemmatimonadota bacterium]|nr:ABC transporter permease [Gemmatimonadota bacterium]